MLVSAKQDCINIQNTQAGETRMLFMPHSPGIYVALVLKDAQDVLKEQEQDSLS